jgi:hypothetical protein
LDKPEAHGGVQTRNWFSQRIGTIQGFIIPEPNFTVYNQRESNLKRASRGMEGGKPSMLYWQPDGRDEMCMELYRQGKITPSAGFSSPITSPLEVSYTASPHVLLTNAGDAETWPEIVLTGPMTNPTIVNSTLEENNEFTISCALAEGETLYINTELGTVLLKTSAGSKELYNRYSFYSQNFAINHWWPLAPGPNEIRIVPPPSGGATASVKWQDAWE